MFGDMKLNKRGWKLKSFEELTYLITDGEHATPKRTDKGIMFCFCMFYCKFLKII